MDELTLILNASEKRLQFALLQDMLLLHAEESETQKNGADTLLPHIKQICEQLGLSPSGIKKIAAAAGPGNFMGIRLTATIAAAFCRANDGLQGSINYMHALACNFYAKEDEIIHIVTSGTRELVHSQCFQVVSGTMQARTDLQLIPYAELLNIPCDYCFGSGTRNEKAMEVLEKHTCTLLPASFDSPAVNSLIHCLQFVTWQKQDISPIYLKECDAIQNLPHIAKLQGRDPDACRQELDRLLNA